VSHGVCSLRFMTQLRLPFDGDPHPDCSGKNWGQRFTADALVIDMDRHSLTFGLWGKLHGVWVTDHETCVSREFLPDWQPLTELGTWRVPERTLLEEEYFPFPSNWLTCREVSSSFIAYFNQIPFRIRRVVGQLKGHQWLALDLIWQVPEFAWFLDTEIAEGRMHYFHACVELSEAQEMSRQGRELFARSLLSKRRSSVLSELTGFPNSRKSHRLFGKISGHEPWSALSYFNVMEVASTVSGAKALAHARTIAHEGITYWQELPYRLKTENLLRLFASSKTTVDLFYEETADLFWNVSDDVLERLRASLSTITNHESLTAWIDGKFQKLIEIHPLPGPPVRGGSQLVPLDSASGMYIEAHKMGNCLDGDIFSVRAGERYYYHWNGSEPATVLLEQSDSGDWYFSQILGPGNIGVSRQTRLYVEAIIDTQLQELGQVKMMPQKSYFPLLQGDFLANDNVPVIQDPPHYSVGEEGDVDALYLCQVERVWS
jgi:hypothetical protein